MKYGNPTKTKSKGDIFMTSETIIGNENLSVNKENPYVTISKKILRDKKLSPKAKGVLCFLLSLPDTRHIHPKNLAESLGIGKDQIYTVLNELIKNGYAKKIESKDERGRFGSVIYEFCEEKLDVPQQIKEKNSMSGNTDAVFPFGVSHGFDTSYAIAYGVEEAIMIRNFQFLITANANRSHNFHEGRFWTCDRLEDFISHFPYWTVQSVRRILQSLLKHGVLIKGDFNKSWSTRTTWYAFKDQEKFIEISNKNESNANVFFLGGRNE